MGNVGIPKWLKELPLAPEFRPTDTEFADPIAYISKIEKEASAFGICKVIPPLPKPSKRYVLNNLNKSLLKCSDLGLDVNLGNSSRVSRGKINDGEARAVFTTRQQELGQSSKRSRGAGDSPQLTSQKQVWQSGEVYTLEQFESKSKVFSRSVLGSVKEVTPQVVEALFWKVASEKPIYVEYANDVPGSGFGEPEGLLRYLHGRKRRRKSSSYGMQHVNSARSSDGGSAKEVSAQILCPSQMAGKESVDQPTSSMGEASESDKQRVLCANSEVEGTAGWKLSNSPWNLQVIARSAGSLTRFMLDEIPGVTSPMIYIAMLFSWFAWHVEDHELHSLNFLHMGSPKTWYAVPGDFAFAFEEVIRREAYGGEIDQLAALKLLGEKTTLLSPESIVASGIPCCRLVQNPGEFVVTFPRAYHVGFSHGFNCGEAANFGTPQWLTMAKDAALRRAAMDHLPMLSHQQLLYLLTMSFVLRVPRSLLPGVRSSRLRDRLKEERELLVKKAFIDDLLKQNLLLNTLSEKHFTLRAVLWHPDSLPSNAMSNVSLGGIPENPVLAKVDEPSASATKSASQDLMHEPTLNMDTVDDLFYTDDLLRDFQIDSGTLPCVACGILGYPFMSVVQPSNRVAAEIFHVEHLQINVATENLQKSKSSHLTYTSKPDSSALDMPRLLRPRIFCLEHAIQVQELLRPKGGAKMLVICHSDYKKIKAHAGAVAEEIGCTFQYKEVPLVSASNEELSLIDAAIDGEQLTDSEVDWTSKLGMNLRHTVKVRTSTSKKLEHALSLNYLVSVIAPGSKISTIKWCSRKCRSTRGSNHHKQMKSCSGNLSKKGAIIQESGHKMEAKEKVLLQYSRRKRTKSGNYGVANCVSRCSVTEVSDTNCGKIDSSDEDAACRICDGITDVASAEIQISGSTENVVLDNEEQLPMAKEPSNEEMHTEAVTSTLNSSMLKEKISPDSKINDGNDISDSRKWCAPAVGILTEDISENGIDYNMQCPNDWITEDEFQNKQDGTCVAETCSIQGMGCFSLDNHDTPASHLSESQGPNVRCKNDCFSTCTESTTTFEVDLPTSPKENHADSFQTDPPACSSVLEEQNKKELAEANVKMGAVKRSKRGRETALHTEIIDGFIRSPCEGLRPRKKQEDPTLKCEGSMSAMSKQMPSTKIRKCSGSSISHSKLVGKVSYKCNFDGCRMSFKTKAELSLHRYNKCLNENCGKRFKTHKYLLLHQQVHDDDRPLKCTWKGCDLTFKWAWARTEHLRLHTGERPYKCEIKGCGRTFIFVSDFSRHRRKMRHFVNQPA